LENQDELNEINKISINYAESGELYNRKTVIVDVHFVSKIADVIDEDLEPKSMA
jgi:hypothetical protein